MKSILSITLSVIILGVTSSCNNETNNETIASNKDSLATPVLKEEDFKINLSSAGKPDSVVLDGYVVYDEKKSATRPAVLVVHEWWGLDDYTKRRARQLAELGYIAIAVDLYGNGKRASDPKTAGELATPFYQDPQMTKERFDMFVEKIKSYPQTDTSRVAAIGYCFGGGMLLNLARMGENLDGVVSFHGSLVGTPANKDLLKANILVCHGGADPFVPQAEVDQFKKQMDSIGARYTFKVYDSATHAFTNPEATAKGKQFNIPIEYNAKADSASWNDMKVFFADIFK